MTKPMLLSYTALRSHEIALWAWGLMLLVLPFSTALALLFSAVGAFFSLLGLRQTLVVQTLRSPVVLIALGLFAWLMLSTLWGIAPKDELLEGAWKYRKLAFVFLVAASILACQKRSEFLINFFLVGCALVALGVLCVKSGLVGVFFGPPSHAANGWPVGPVLAAPWLVIGGPENPTIGRNHITQGAFLAFASMFALGRAWVEIRRETAGRLVCFGWVSLALCYMTPIFWLQGRSGYVLAIFGVIFWVALSLVRLKGFRRLTWAGSLVACLSLIIFYSPHFASRSLQAFHDVVTYSDVGRETSQGQRLNFWKAGIELARKRPISGLGVGGYAQAYSEVPTQPEVLKISRSQPHSEWIILLVQGGLVAAAMFGLLAIYGFRGLLTKRVRDGGGDNMFGLLCVWSLFFLYAAFNSAVWDLAEGHFFAILLAGTMAGQRPN